MPATVGSTSPLANSSRRKEAARKASAEAGRRQIGAALSGAAVLSSGAAAPYPCRAVAPTTDSSYTACRTQAAHGGSVSVPYEELPRMPPCVSAARETIEQQLGDARRHWIDTHLALNLEVDIRTPVLVTQGSPLPAAVGRQAALDNAGWRN